MEVLPIPWSNWCRLCGKQDAENKVKIHTNTNDEKPTTTNTNKEPKLTLQKALGKYFWVNSSINDFMPKHLCSDCNELVSSIILFDERVDRVQQMYKYLIQNCRKASYDYQAIRKKFKVCDDNVVHISQIQKYSKLRHKTSSIQQEVVRSVESEYSEIDKNDDVCHDDTSLQGEKRNVRESEENGYAMDTNFKDSIWVDDDSDSEEKLENSKINAKNCNTKLTKASTKTAATQDVQPIKEKHLTDFAMNITCTDCVLKFPLFSAYCDHMETVHKSTSLVKSCPICNRSVPNVHHLGEHLRSHTVFESLCPIKCRYCESRFETTAKLKRHISYTHRYKGGATVSRGYDMCVCSYCKARFKTAANLERHIIRKHRIENPNICPVGENGGSGYGLGTSLKPLTDFEMDITCTHCELKFPLFSVYCDHMETAHNSTSLVKSCPICNRSVPTVHHLGEHLRSHSVFESLCPIKCPDCENRFETTSKLEAHISQKHRNKCEATKSSLYQHMFAHTDDAPFECKVCHKRFKKKAILNGHMDTHAPRKFVCNICGLQLCSKSALTNHFLVHSDNKHYKCVICDASFKHNWAFKGHLILHSGLKPFKCSFCDQSFASQPLRLFHMKKKHPKETSQIVKPDGTRKYTKDFIPTLKELKAICIIKASNISNPTPGRVTDPTSSACYFCDIQFTCCSRRKAHMKFKHPEEFALLEPTEITDRINKQKKMKKSIAKAAKAKPQTNFEICEFCGRTFRYRRLWQDHMRRIHINEWEALKSAKNKTQVQSIPKQERVIKSQIYEVHNSMLPTNIVPVEMASTNKNQNVEDYIVILD